MLPEIIRDDIFRVESGRLWLRWPHLCDSDRLLPLFRQSSSGKSSACSVCEEDMVGLGQFISVKISENEKGKSLFLMITLKKMPFEPIGYIEMHDVKEGVAYLRYGMSTLHSGLGFMTEALEIFLESLFFLTKIKCFVAELRAKDVASHSLLQKCGFKEMSEKREDLTPSSEARIYRLFYADWLALREASI